MLLGEKTPIALIEGDTRSIYLIPTKWIGYLQENLSEGFDLHHLGKHLGVLAANRFRISLQVLPELVSLTKNLLVVSKHGAEAFTYGRSILKESIVSFNPDLKRAQRVLVVNETHDCLGIASLSVDAARIERLSKDSLVGKNLVDIGWFIRRMS